MYFSIPSIHSFVTAVSEELVVLLQERHDIRQQVDMRKIAVEQLLTLATPSSTTSVPTGPLRRRPYAPEQHTDRPGQPRVTHTEDGCDRRTSSLTE